MKKNTLVKILCLVLVCLMIVPFVVACGGGNDNTDTGNNNGGNNNNNNNGGDSTGNTNTVTISYDPGQGLLEDDEWEVTVNKGDRFTNHPTPTHAKENMMFDGWYTDDKCTEPVKMAQKYTEDVTLYAKWTQVNQCVDGSYEHPWGAYYIIEDATCTTPAIQGRDCPNCGSVLRSEDISQPALGHDFGKPTEAGFANVVECRRTGGGEKVYTDFVDITGTVLGNSPANQVQLTEGSGTIFGEERVSCIVNGNWDEQNGSCFCGKGGQIVVTITLFTPSSFDRIYMKGRGQGASFDILVQYQGDSEFVRVGGGAFLSDEENTKPEEERKIPFAEVDNTKVVEKVQIKMPTPSNGSDFWEEIGFFKLP